VLRGEGHAGRHADRADVVSSKPKEWQQGHGGDKARIGAVLA
jgi:hypothetical protein